MHRVFLSACLLGTLVTPLASIPAQAQTKKSDPWKVQNLHLELGAFAGFLRPSDSHELFNDGAGIEQRRLETLGLDVGARIGFYPASFFGVEVEGALMPTSLRDEDGSALLYRIGAHGVLQYPGRFSPFAVVGLSSYGISSDADVQGNDSDLVFHWGLGAKYFLTENFGLRVDGRHIVGPRVQPTAADTDNISSHFEVLVGLAFAFGRHAGGPDDSDDDGIVDPLDKCPNRAGLAPDGCPARDTDKDGVIDRKDKCPRTKGDGKDGCPVDSDGDGKPDVNDACPNEAASTDDGCPDGDGDGVPDRKDECVDVAGDQPNGCPDPDPDKDGVLGAADKCPNVASSEPDGCPAQDADKDGVEDDKDSCPQVHGKGPDGCPLDTDQDGVDRRAR